LDLKFVLFIFKLLYETYVYTDRYLVSYMQLKQKMPAGKYLGINAKCLLLLSLLTKTGLGSQVIVKLSSILLGGNPYRRSLVVQGVWRTVQF
jgi:hypothetical protein